jgi:large subunit ribosomal protein L10
VLRREKESIVTELHERIKDSRFVILTTFNGMNVEKMTDLRNRLRKVGGTYRVVKNTLLKRAAQETDLQVLEECLVGSSAIIIAENDPIGPCKVLREFRKESQQVEVKRAVLEGRVLTQVEVEELATLPSRAVLLSKLLFLLKAPQQRLVSVLAGVPQKFVRVLDAIRQQKEG